ncbi:MFS general substrate transporter [Panaeolus papilionaceus]|nr:MFS general substrate transporter [Panaeolus papilionaceus]
MPHQDERTPLIGKVQDVTPKQRKIARVQFLSLCWSLFLLGWNDGSIGPLLPRIQSTFNVGYASVSWIFVILCSGVVVGALINMPLTDRFGFGKVKRGLHSIGPCMLVVGALTQAMSFILQGMAPSFLVFVGSFFIGGLGMAWQDAHANGFIAALHDETKMGILHAAYGSGALFAPLSATQFAQMEHWSFHYLVSLTLSIINTSILAIVFRFAQQDECLADAGEVITEHPQQTVSESKYGQLLRTRAVHLLALFLLMYVGVEVTIGGWIVTFMIRERGGGLSSGYIASGFFGGLTAGRVLLIWVNKKIGEVRVVYLYAIISLALQLVVWLVPIYAVDAVAVCLIGVVLGPLYPIIMNHTGRVLPRALVTGAIGWVAACGAAGSALLPFLTGAMASQYGIISLQPLLVVMMAIMGGVWILVPKRAVNA